MDSLKSLMDRKDYELVVKITEDTQDINHLFYRISALLALGRGEEALNVIKKNRKILENDLSLLMKVHIEILCLLGKFDEAYEEVKYYEGLPYVSQKVEELLKELPKLVREEEKKAFSSKELTDEQLMERLMSSNADVALPAIDMVRNRDVNKFMPQLEEIMVKFPKQVIRSFALLLLVQKQVDKQVKFNHVGEIITVNPKELEPPFVGEDFNNFVKEFQKVVKNPSVNDDAIQILSSYILYMYPQKITVNYDVLIESLKTISEEYLQVEQTDTLEERCEQKNLNLEEVKELIYKIKEVLKDF